jgi:Zn-dependent protease
MLTSQQNTDASYERLMKWSLRLGTIAGIGVFVHATFFLLIAWVGYSHYVRNQSVADAIEGVLFICALFGCVVAHEFGHALTARRYGIKTRDITLLPIGGLARLERMPDDPKQELWVALAGPAVNVVIAGAIFAWLTLTGYAWTPEAIGVAEGDFLARLCLLNVILVAFNLLPAFPMDGGRVLRALLALRMDYNRATQTAASVGQAMALLFGLIGLFSNPMLLFIALFVWMGAEAEASMTSMRSALAGLPVSTAMMRKFHTVQAGEALSQPVELALGGSQHDFPVLQGDRLVGVLTRHDVMAGLASGGLEQRVEDAMSTDIQTTQPGEMLEVAFQRLQQCGCRVMPVLQSEVVVGLLTMDSVGEFLSVQSALNKRGARLALG